MDTNGGKPWGGGGVMNWSIGIDMYTLMCRKLMTNKNLLYKKIKFKNKTKKKKLCSQSRVEMIQAAGSAVFLLSHNSNAPTASLTFFGA